VFVEFTFGWQGMGSLAVQAVGDRDYPLIMAIVLVSSVLVVVGGALAEILQAASDPRQRRA
jgi:peptide/nickel transport system permease protein